MKSEHTQAGKLSRNLANYLYSLKSSDKNEVYETLLLMMLFKGFSDTLEALVVENLSRIKADKKNINFDIRTSKEYRKVINNICNSKYFVDNFTKSEIERKRAIANGMIVEIIMQSGLQLYVKDLVVNSTFHNVMFPSIKHEVSTENGVEKMKLIFDEGTPLNELTKYLKEILEVKNVPKKKKLSLGQSYRILLINDEIRQNPDKYKTKDFGYIEQVISKEMNKRYKEKVSMEAVSKSIQRIKKIQKLINTKKDK